MPGLEKTANTWRIRQTPPEYNSYATKDIGGGVSLVLGIKSGKSETQSVVFHKKQFPTADSVKAWIGKHKEYHMSEAEDGDIVEANENNFTENYFDTVEFLLSENKNWSWNEILTEGTFINSATGKPIEVTEPVMDDLINHFNENVRGMKLDDMGNPAIPWDYFHEADKEAAGWISALEKRDHVITTQEAKQTKFAEGQIIKSLWAKNSTWTPKAQAGLTDGTYRGASVDFHDYYNPATKKIIKNVLFGVALTNRPAVHWMAPVRLSEQGKSPSPAPAAKLDEHKNMKGVFKMSKLLDLLNEKGAKLTESAPAETVEYAAVEKITALSEINKMQEVKLAETTKKLDEAEKAKVTAEKKLSELTESEKTRKEAEVKAKCDEMTKLAEDSGKFTPAELKNEKNRFVVALKEGRFEDAEYILGAKGVKIKKADESGLEDEGENENEKELDPNLPWEKQENEAIDNAVEKHMEKHKMTDGKMSEREKSVAYGKALDAVRTAHKTAFKAREDKGGKK